MTPFTGRIKRTNAWSLPIPFKPCSLNVFDEVIKLTNRKTKKMDEKNELIHWEKRA
jgi:hypothetical protein